jgi:hypothetical protein
VKSFESNAHINLVRTKEEEKKTAFLEVVFCQTKAAA